MNNEEWRAFQEENRATCARYNIPPEPEPPCEYEDIARKSGMVLKNLIDIRTTLQGMAKPDHWIKPSKESIESMNGAIGGVQLAINEEQARYDAVVILRDAARAERKRIRAQQREYVNQIRRSA